MQQKVKDPEPQVEYLGRWVPRKHFRVYVYGQEGQKLVDSYDEYKKALASGLWFSTLNELNNESINSQIPKFSEEKPILEKIIEKSENKPIKLNKFKNGPRGSRKL